MYKKESMWGKTDKKALLEAVRNVVVQEKMSTIAMRYEVTRLDCFTFQLIIQSDALGGSNFSSSYSGQNSRYVYIDIK